GAWLDRGAAASCRQETCRTQHDRGGSCGDRRTRRCESADRCAPGRFGSSDRQDRRLIMRKSGLQHGLFESLCACLILAPCAVLAQQAGQAAPQAAPAAADAAPTAANTQSAATPAPAAGNAAPAAGNAAPARSVSAKPTEDLEPAVDTSADATRARTERERGAKAAPRGRRSGKAMDHLELGTTDITGNRELPKVMYIVPWKRSDLGDLTGKPLNSLVDQALEPVDRNVFERANRYYGAVTAGANSAGPSASSPSASSSSGNAPRGAAPHASASPDVHRTPAAGSGSAVRDER